jgi:hypothetical protein
MRCSGERHLKHLPLAFLNSSSLKRDMGMGLLSRGGGLFFPPTVRQPSSMKACPSRPPGLGEATTGMETTDLSGGRENWEEGCSGAADPAGAIKTSLNDAGTEIPACTSDNRVAPLGMGPAGGGGSVVDGLAEAGGLGLAMGHAGAPPSPRGRRPRGASEANLSERGI